jgi:hypothetical protein
MQTSRVYKSDLAMHFEENTEFFLLPSYSALPTVVEQLFNLENNGRKAVLFCFSWPLYQFLSPLMQVFAWIKVIYIDDTELSLVSLYRPWEIWRARKILKAIYLKWFVGIPSGSAVHFYNYHFALPVFYMIWKIRNSSIIHYAECDPVELLYEQDTTLYSWIKLAFLSLIYSMPFQMVSRENDPVKPFPSLTNSFLKKTVKVRYPMVTDLHHLRQTDIYQALCCKSNAQVLWLMGMDLDIGWVVPGEYERTLEKCAAIVVSVYPATEQVIKFHPRSHARENAWDVSVIRLPEHVPAEFLDFSRLKIVLAVSSAAVIAFSAKAKIVGLVDLIPFVTQMEREINRATLLSRIPNAYCPSTLEDLRVVLKETLEMDNLP